MLHISNLLHVLIAAAAWGIIVVASRRIRGSRFAISMRLLQIVPALFALDMIIGFIVIDEIYGPHQSAVWISRSALIFPALYVAALWRLFRRNKAQGK